MTILEFSQIAGSAGALLAVCNIVWTWHAHAQLPGKKALDDLDCRVDDHAARIQSIEAELRHMPTKDDLGRVELGLERMLGEMRVVQSEVQGSGRTLRRLEDHLRGEKA